MQKGKLNVRVFSFSPYPSRGPENHRTATDVIIPWRSTHTTTTSFSFLKNICTQNVTQGDCLRSGSVQVLFN